MTKSGAVAAFSGLLTLFSLSPAFGQELAPASETTRFVIDTAALIFGALGLVLAYAGFAMRDAGMARTQNTPAVCLRMMGGLGVAALAMWATGFHLMNSVEPGGFLGEFGFWAPQDDPGVEQERAEGAMWVMRTALALIGLAVVSGAVSERVKLWPFLTYGGLYCAVIYPIVVSWVWGGGYFASEWRFHDFAGAGAVHISAGAAALAGVLVVGPRPGRYANGGARLTPSTALPLSAFGAGLILVGLLANFTASYVDLASYEAMLQISGIFVKALLAVGSAVLAALMVTKIVYQRAGFVSSVNALIGAMVAISADPISPALWQAAMIGAVSGVIVTVAPPFLDRLRIDDAGFVIPAHLLCGMWGILVTPWTNAHATIFGQFIGAVAIAGFSFFMALLGWAALRYTVGVRHTPPDSHFLGGEEEMVNGR